MRLFVGGPVWTAYNRPHDHLPARYNDVLFSHIVTTKLTRSVVIYLSKEATKVFMYIQTAIL